ncbi:MAG: ABC transporter substrate-binding protein [Alphaproteobacteria bacterium]|nr:ABC transporter substrate-binding protein [Alphaproteobacteria bacterium]
MRLINLVTASALALAAASMPASAKTFKWANDGDVSSMDPFARNETFLLTFMSNIYEPLVRRDRNLKLEPALAVKWGQASPTVWRFDLRPGVKFSDGSPFTADDAVFSLTRANSQGSNMTGYFVSVKEIRKAGDLAVEVETKYPDPLLDQKFAALGMMSKAWAEKNNAQQSADLTKMQENFATRNAMGTGPFVLSGREPDVRTTLKPNAGWWDKPEHNLTEVIFSRVANDATRVAALLSGEIDMIYTVPPQDTERLKNAATTKVLEGPETRVVYLGFDHLRPELLHSNVKGKNPFKDKRVREAFYRAIDVESIRTKVMRGQATPVALMVAPGINGYAKELDVRPKYDPALSRKLLAEAGYPEGFEVQMDCPNDRYVNDEKICQAVVAMLARINIRVFLLAQTRTRYFAQILGPAYNTSFFMLGWSPAATYDTHNPFEQLIQSRPERGKGLFNVGGYSNKAFDALADKIEVETDKAKRDAMIKEAHRLYRDDFAYIPLHQQALVWAMKRNVDLVQPADNSFPLRFVNLK